MAKKFSFGGKGRLRMLAGIDLLADAVEITLGPNGRNVLIQHRTPGVMPIYTRDGVTVVRALEAGGKVQNAGVSMMRMMTARVASDAGDGTSTAIVLARFIAARAVKAMCAGVDPKALREGIETGVRTLAGALKKLARECSGRAAIAHIGAMASNGDEGIGRMLADAFERTGPDGVIVFELGTRLEDTIEFVEGAEWAQGYPSRYFVTDKNRETAELEEPYVLLYDRAIHRFDELLPVLDAVKRQNGSLLIIAEDIEEAALPGLLLNHIRCVLKAVAVKPPAFGNSRDGALADLAILLGGRAILEACGDDLSRVRLKDLGRAKRVVVHENHTVIAGGAGNKEAIQERIAMVRQLADAVRERDLSKGSIVGKAHDLEQLEDRIRRLSGVAAVIEVGGVSDLAIKERMQRFGNALNSIRGAMSEGVLPGGGVGLLRARGALAALPRASLDVQCGIDIVFNAAGEPARLIGGNAGEDGGETARRILAHADEFWGFDARRGVFGNLYELGVLDSARVIRIALRQAAATASALMTAECVITQIPPKDPLYGYTPEWAAATREDPRV